MILKGLLSSSIKLVISTLIYTLEGNLQVGLLQDIYYIASHRNGPSQPGHPFASNSEVIIVPSVSGLRGTNSRELEICPFTLKHVIAFATNGEF